MSYYDELRNKECIEKFPELWERTFLTEEMEFRFNKSKAAELVDRCVIIHGKHTTPLSELNFFHHVYLLIFPTRKLAEKFTIVRDHYKQNGLKGFHRFDDYMDKKEQFFYYKIDISSLVDSLEGKRIYADVLWNR